MSNWKTYKLGEIATRIGDGLHGTPKYDENGEYYFINGSNLINGKIVINSNTRKVDEIEYLKHKKELSDNTILVGINGTIGNIALYQNEKCILGKSAAYINVNDNFDKLFIRYVLANEHFQRFIKTNASGTTIKNVGLGLLREYEFQAPKDKEEQKEIAQILSSLDDKIELLQQMNQTLENIAQAIFKEWFVDFNFPEFDGEFVDGLPKGWKMGKVKDVCSVNSKSLSTKDTIDEVHYVEISEVDKGIINNIKKYQRGEEPSRAKRKLTHGDTVLSTVRPNRGSYFISLYPSENLIASTGFAVFTPISVPFSFLYFFLTGSEQLEFYGKMADGAAYPAINQSVIMEMNLIIPTNEILELFHNVAGNSLIKCHNNLEEIKILSQTRDTLLPKLMSGELEIKN